ncbi:MAG TPA: DEAD/DEAH box helicase [Sphingobacteriaceae bacterium]
MWSEKLKLSKQLSRSVTEAGFLTPKEIQSRTLSRIIGGHDLIAVAPEGSGKTTAWILGVLSRLKYGFEEAPRALVLAPTRERVQEVAEKIDLLNKNKSIRVVELYATPGTEAQMDALADGADIVVATPDRARAIYLKLGLNLNKIMMLVIDDAEEIVRQGLQLPVAELANSITRCQHLVFTTVLHGKLQQMIEPFMKLPAVIEVDELQQSGTEFHDQLLYQVPNFRTKVNLLKLLLNDDEVFTRVAVFVNTRLTAEKVYQHLKPSLKSQASILNPVFFESNGVESMEEFLSEEGARVLIIANEIADKVVLSGLPFIIHLEVPEEKELFLSRVIRPEESDADLFAITFATDLELGQIRKIEQAMGQKLPVGELPEGLIIETGDEPRKTVKTVRAAAEEPRGAAFHEKKASNAKDYNYSAGTKAKMNKKKKH